jgi:D-alanine-D-alanine ligase-like ATP-grasp enzyme
MPIAEIGSSMGISVELEPEYQFAGELVFPDGRRHLFRNTNFNVNPAGSTEIAKDKGYTSFFLRKHGLNAPKNKAFFSEKLNANLPTARRRGVEAAIEFAEKLGFPVFIKPNNLSQGAFVTKAYCAVDIYKVAQQIFERTDVLLVEQACQGRDYRVVVLGSKIISAYERIPLAVIGDSKHSIEELLQHAKAKLAHLGRPNSEIDISDHRIDIKLRELGKTRNAIPAEGERVVLLDNANLSTGGTSADVSDTIHASFSDIAIKATKTLGLQLCGVDILCDDLTQNASNQAWNIIELNAAPGLDNYASLGVEQANRVKSLYREILAYLANHDV